MTTTKETGHGHFDRWAPSYDQSILQRFMFGPVHEAALDAFIAEAPAPRAILDVGCGTGRLLEAAALRWVEAQFTGADVSEAMIAEAQRKHEKDARYTFKRADASALPFEAESFDAVFNTMSFHHWGDQPAGIREAARVLKKDGLFVLADIDIPLLFLWRPIANRGDHAKMQGPRDIQRMIEQAGLSVVTKRRHWLPWQLFVARKRG
jgi:ubiquinone/menaquinone biosynthesis C-methylase UbiE